MASKLKWEWEQRAFYKDEDWDDLHDTCVSGDLVSEFGSKEKLKPTLHKGDLEGDYTFSCMCLRWFVWSDYDEEWDSVELSFDDVDLSEAQKRIPRRIPKYIIKEWQDFLEKVA